jgi:hypothetical protein
MVTPLVGGDGAQVQWEERVQRLWGKAPAGKGDRRVGKGRLMWGETLPRPHPRPRRRVRRVENLAEFGQTIEL